MNWTCWAGECESERWNSGDVNDDVAYWWINSKIKIIRSPRIHYYLENCHLKDKETEAPVRKQFWKKIC